MASKKNNNNKAETEEEKILQSTLEFTYGDNKKMDVEIFIKKGTVYGDLQLSGNGIEILKEKLPDDEEESKKAAAGVKAFFNEIINSAVTQAIDSGQFGIGQFDIICVNEKREEEKPVEGGTPPPVVDKEGEKKPTAGFGLELGFKAGVLKKDLSFNIQVATSKKRKKKPAKPSGTKAGENTTTPTTEKAERNYSFSILPNINLVLSEIPGLSIKLSKPLVIKVDRVSYAKGKHARFYEKEFGVEKIYTMPDIKSVALPEGLSYASSLSGLEFIKTLDVGYDAEIPAEDFDPEEFNLFEDIDIQPPTEESTVKSTPSRNLRQATSTEAKPFELNNGILEIKLDKAIGPLRIASIQVTYKDNKIKVGIDASFKFLGFNAHVINLSLGRKLLPYNSDGTKNKLEVDLDGVALSLKRSDVEIGGMIMKVEKEYVGQVFIKISDYTLIGTAIYGKIGGSTSLFLHGFLGAPIGGKPYFFVLGLALGVGINRACKVPIEGVKDFPLTKQALDLEFPETVEDIKATATNMIKFMPARKGNFIIMLGLKFHSFKIFEAFALLIVQISNTIRIDILGLSRLTIDTKKKSKNAVEKKLTVVSIELALKASFIPAEGVFSVEGAISPDSFIFHEDCKISGGFALITWFSGDHAGDFVLTLGGYHPRYKKPKHYPVVPRLALNWKVNDELKVKAEAYFALTPSEAMAGGLMEMNYEKGRLKADFNVGADFYVSWKPFHYDAQVYVGLKISYEVYLKFKVVFVRVTIDLTVSLDASAKLHIWGPEFSGEGQVNFHLTFFGIKFGFTANIRFGDQNSKQAPKLNWEGFKTSFLPENKDLALSLNAKEGLIREDGEKENPIWVMNKKAVAFTLETPIPVTAYKDGEHSSILATWGGMRGNLQQLTITPMGDKAFTSEFTIKMTKDGTRLNNPSFEIKKSIKRNLPASLWGGGTKKDNLIHGLTTGFEVVYTEPPVAGGTSEIPEANFKFSTFQNNETINYIDSDENFDFENLLKVANTNESFMPLDKKMISYQELLTNPQEENIIAEVELV